MISKYLMVLKQGNNHDKVDENTPFISKVSKHKIIS